MAINYNFSADPNAAPNNRAIPSFIDALAKGYQMSQMPKQMKMKQQLDQAQLADLQARTGLTNQQSQYYGDDINSQIAERQAQAEEAQARTGLTNEQKKYYGQDIMSQTNLRRAQAESAQAEAEQARRTSNMQQSVLDMLTGSGNGQPAPQGGGYQSGYQSGQGTPGAQEAPQPAPQAYQPGSGQAPVQNQQPSPNAQMQPQQGAPQAGPQQGSDIDFAPGAKTVAQGNPALYGLDSRIYQNQALVPMLAKMGMPVPFDQKTTYDAASGNQMTTTTLPSGRVIQQMTQVTNPYMTNLNSNMGKMAATDYQKHSDILNDSINIQSNLKTIANVLEKNGITDAVGPMNSWFNKKGLGAGSAQDVMGQLEPYLGKVQASVANSISGNAARAKLYFAQQVKPSTSDPAALFMGKLEAANTLNQWSMDYEKAYTGLVASGVPTAQASQMADKAVPYDKYQGQMQKYLQEGSLAAKYQKDGVPVVYDHDAEGNLMPHITVKDENGKSYPLLPSQYKQYLSKGGS